MDTLLNQIHEARGPLWLFVLVTVATQVPFLFFWWWFEWRR